MEFERQYDEFGRKRNTPPGKEECLMSCEVVKGSADGDAESNWRAQIQAKERQWGLRSAYAAELPMDAEQWQTGRELTNLEWNRCALNLGWGGDWGAPILEDISKKHFRLGGMPASEWTRSVRAVRDTPVADISAPGVNTTRRVAYRTPITVSAHACIWIAMQWVTLRKSLLTFLLH